LKRFFYLTFIPVAQQTARSSRQKRPATAAAASAAGGNVGAGAGRGQAQGQGCQWQGEAVVLSEVHSAAVHPSSHAPHLAVQEEYQDPDTLWQKAKGQDGTHREWYQGAVSYWDNQEASYDGVLGGFGYVSDYDISDSSALLTRVSGGSWV
jgi:hypothetical protein